MTDGISAAFLGTLALALGYATWWLIRHEAAVRRFRAGSDRPRLSERAD